MMERQSIDYNSPSTVGTLEELETRMATIPDYEGKMRDVNDIVSLYDKKRWNVIKTKLGMMERQSIDYNNPSTVGTLEELETRMATIPDYEGKMRDVNDIVSLYDKKRWNVIKTKLEMMERRAKDYSILSTVGTPGRTKDAYGEHARL